MEIAAVAKKLPRNDRKKKNFSSLSFEEDGGRGCEDCRKAKGNSQELAFTTFYF